jgi:osmoprotectant transport system substrate-binding protein
MRSLSMGVLAKRSAGLVAGVAVAALLVTACSSSNPAASGSGSGPSSTSAAMTSSGSMTSSGAGSMTSSGAMSSAGSMTSSAAMASSGAGSASGSGAPAAGGSIVVGSGNFTESELLAGIYVAALKAKGVNASSHLDIGNREAYLKALEDGSISLFPEYTGNLLAYYDKTSTVSDPEGVYAALQKALPATLQVLNPSQAEDQDSVAVTQATATKYHLTSIADLAPVAGQLTLGGSPEWQTRADGPPGMKKIYGVTFGSYKVLDAGGPLSVKGLSSGLVQASDIFTTDPAIKANNFVVLDDPKHLFTAQQVVPLIAKSVVTPQVSDVLNAVSAKLTTADLTTMLADISANKSDPGDVGTAWVKSVGLG